MPPITRRQQRSYVLLPSRAAESTLDALLSVLATIRRVEYLDAGSKADDRAERETLTSIKTAAYVIRSILSQQVSELNPETTTIYPNSTAILDAVEDAVEVDQQDLVLEQSCAACVCPFQKTNKNLPPKCHALCHSAKFRCPNSDARDHLRRTLINASDELQIRFPDNDDVQMQPAGKRRRNPPWYIPVSADHVFHAISQCRHGLGGCPVVDHLEAHLALATYLSIGEEDGYSVDLLFALDTERQRCHEVRMHAECPARSRTDTEAGPPQRKVMFADQRRRRKIPEGNVKKVSHFCELLGASKVHHNAAFRVNVSVDANSILWQQIHPQTQRKIKQADLSSSVSLATILASDTRELSDMAKLVLAVILSYSLFYLFNGPWLGPRQGAEWSQRNIIFLTKGGTIPLRPFLRSDLRSDSLRPSHEDAEAEESLHQYPALLCFGITLLEVYLGQTIESFLDLNEPLTSLDDRYARACEVFEKRKSFIRGEYRQAIDACLKTQFWVDGVTEQSEDEAENETGDQEAADNHVTEHLRSMIFNDIVRPLHDDLERSFGELMEFQDDLDKQAASMDFRSGLSVVEVNGIRPINDHQKNWRKRKASTNEEEYTQSKVNRATLEHAGNGSSHALSGEPSPQLSELPQECSPTDNWFRKFRGLGALLDLQQLKPGDQGRVRVAILDTGIDMGHIDMQAAAANGQIVKVCDWVDGRGGADDENVGDSEGHGTHIASVILGMAPHVDLYIARVTKTRGLSNSEAENVAEAIRTAAFDWKCDIISLSLGFDRGVSCIHTELESAIDAGALVFAAASNDGANSGLAYPAWHSRVFCTYSTDGYGNKSPFNPPAEMPNEADSFSIVGQHVLGAWPSNLSPEGTNDYVRRLSGTSYATPVAASVAASVLGFASITREADKLKTSFLKLSRYDGMRRVLWKMTKPIDGYRYLCPFSFFEREQCEIANDIWKALNPEK